MCPAPRHERPERPKKGYLTRMVLGIRYIWAVSSTGEQLFMGSAPFWVFFLVIQGRLGIPTIIRAYEFFLFCIYTGAWFVMLVVLDRRTEHDRLVDGQTEAALKKQERSKKLADREAARAQKRAQNQAARKTGADLDDESGMG